VLGINFEFIKKLGSVGSLIRKNEKMLIFKGADLMSG
jgi:hypothetical protein